MIFILFFASCGSNNGISFEKIPEKVLLTESNHYLKINPYKNAPLSAELTLKKRLKYPLTVTVKGQDGSASDISYTWHDTNKTQFPIIGMYFDYTNTVILTSGNDSKQIHIVITEKPASFIEKIEVLTNNRPDTLDRSNFLDFFNPVGTLKDLFATDNFGKIRWYMTSPVELHGMKFKELSNEVAFSILNTESPEILTYSLTGKLLNKINGPKTHKYNVPEADKRFHHDMFYRKNGNIIVLDKSQYGVEDTILELTPEGQIVQEILIGNWIRNSVNNSPDDYTGLTEFTFDTNTNPVDEYTSEIRYPGMPKEKNAIDWAHINALSYDENTDTLFVSLRQHGIFAFDYNMKKLKWIYIRPNYTIPTANLPFYNLPDTLKYVYQIPALKPYILNGKPGPDHPHAITHISNNTFMAFDNSGNDGEFPQEGSRLLVFSVYSNNAVINWEYRHRDTNKQFVYSQVVSDIDKTPFNSYIGLFGTKVPFTYVEISEDKKVLFDLRLTIKSKNTGDSDIAVPIACPTSRLLQNGILLYRADYQPVYPRQIYSLD
ncbi:MAG: aryl-sulfate sulfotransferase [Brevinemataceae bacterium]